MSNSVARKALFASLILLLFCAIFQVRSVPSAESPTRTMSTYPSSGTVGRQQRFYKNVPGKVLSGIASWYGDLFNGRSTASGEIFDQSALTACHPTLPFGTFVRVINLRNHRSVVVRINDRGVRSDRIIDLSSAAAEKLGMLETGVAPVRIVILSGQKS